MNEKFEFMGGKTESLEDRILKRKEDEKRALIERGLKLDLEKEITQGEGSSHLEELFQAINDEDKIAVENILKQIGNDLNILTKFPDPAAIEEMGRGEYRINCLSGSAGKRGMLKMQEGIAVLKFPDLENIEHESGFSMKTAVEFYFGILADENNAISLEIGRVD